MMDDRRQTIDTADGSYVPPPRGYPSNTDDASATQNSTTTANTLAEFLVGPQKDETPHDRMSSEKLSRLRRKNEEARAAINALNQFIFVAGHTFKGRQLNKTDQKRLREAAKQVGLSLEVVDTLVEQTSDKNAVLKYCMASDDAFARKMKNDPQLSRLLEEGAKDDGSGFDVSASVWRVFMHKIIQQFLKEHDMDLSDVMSKESLTSRLYQEALRNEKRSADEAEAARIRCDYTTERQRLFISEEEAQLARQQAEARMDIPTYRSFLGLLPSDGEDYIMSDCQPIVTDDILSLRPGVYPPDDVSTVASGAETLEQNHRRGSRRSGVRRRQSAHAEAVLRKKPAASDGEEEVSAVKRGLAVFGKSLSQSREDVKRQRRSSLEALEQSKVVKSRAKSEVGHNENMEMEHPESRRQQRHSLAVLQESSILNSRAIFEAKGSQHVGNVQRAGSPLRAPNVNRLNPNIAKVFERHDSTGRIEVHKLDSHLQANRANRAMTGSALSLARQNFEMSHNGEFSEGESKPVRPARDTIDLRNALERKRDHDAQKRLKKSGVGDKSQRYEAAGTVENELCDDTILNSGAGHDTYAQETPEVVIVQKHSDDSNGVLSSLTESSSLSQEDGQSHNQRRSSRSIPKRQSRTSLSESELFQESPAPLGHSRMGNGPHEIDSMKTPISSSTPPRQMEYFVTDCDRHQSSNKLSNGPQHESTKAFDEPYHTANGETFSDSHLPPHQEHLDQRFRVQNTQEESGWVDFGSTFRRPQSTENLGGRRGAFEEDNDSTRQPSMKSISLSPSMGKLSEDRRENVVPESNRKKSQVSEIFPNRIKQPIVGSSASRKGRGVLSEQTGDWTNFQENLFSTHQTREKKTKGIVEYGTEEVWQLYGPNPASASTSDDSMKERVTGHFRNVGGGRSTKKSKHSSKLADPYKQGNRSDDRNNAFNNEQLPNLVVWSADVDTSAQNSHHMLEAFRPNNTGGSKRAGSSKYHTSNIDHAFRRVDDVEQQSFDTSRGSLGLYGQTEPTRSMSSESDFDVLNSYHDSDVRRIESIQASENSRMFESRMSHPQSDHDSLPHSARQPDAPLVSHRGSRVSDVMGVASRSRAPKNVMGDSVAGSFSSHMGLKSFPISTMTSNIDSTSNLTHMGGSPSHPSTNERQEKRSRKLQHRMPTPHYSNQPSSEDDFEALSSYLDSVSAKNKKLRSNVPPHTPTGLATPSFQSNPTPKARPFSSSVPAQRHENFGSLDAIHSSDTLSEILMENTVTSREEEEARDDINCRPHPHNHDSRGRYLDSEPDFDESSPGPTSPTQLRSADSEESTVDEEDIRLAAHRRGISPDIVDVLLSQTNSKIRRAPLKGVEVPTPTKDQHSYEAPIDSDTCRPASVRHLRKDVGPDCDPIYEQGTSWNEIADHQGHSYRSHNSRVPPPPPDPEAQAILEALQENAADMARNLQSMPGMPELPEGATEEQVNLLNRFIEVAASNFDGKKLSADSEKRVRAAAEKVGLSQKFVDQLLQQANTNNASRTMEATTEDIPIPAVGVPDYSMEEDLDEASTYYTRDRTQSSKRTKKRVQDVGCNAWEQLEYMKNLVQGWANCGTPGDVHHEEEDDDDDDDDDGSSISSDGYRDELTRKLRKAQKKKKGRKSKPARAQRGLA